MLKELLGDQVGRHSQGREEHSNPLQLVCPAVLHACIIESLDEHSTAFQDVFLQPLNSLPVSAAFTDDLSWCHQAKCKGYCKLGGVEIDEMGNAFQLVLFTGSLPALQLGTQAATCCLFSRSLQTCKGFMRSFLLPMTVPFLLTL